MGLFHAVNEINRIFDYLMTAAVFFLFFFFLTVQVSFEVQQFSLSRSVRNNNLAQMIMVGVAS